MGTKSYLMFCLNTSFLQCFTPENLLSIHAVQKSAGISQSQFKEICPSLIQQIESGSCKTPSTSKTTGKETGWKRKLGAKSLSILKRTQGRRYGGLCRQVIGYRLLLSVNFTVLFSC